MRLSPFVVVGAGAVMLLVWFRVRSKETTPPLGYTANPQFMTNIQPNPGTIRGNIMAPGGGTFI